MPITGPELQKNSRKRKRVWLLPDPLAVEPLLAAFEHAFAVAVEPERRTRATWCDTFDWRLYSRGLLLYHDRAAWHLVSRDSTGSVAAIDAPGGEQWRFCQDFPPGRLRSVLEPVVTVRRLLTLFSSETMTVCRCVLNRDDKTVARLLVETHRIGDRDPVVTTLCLQGLRGYDRDFANICDFLNRHGAGHQVGPYCFFDQGVRTGGRSPLDYATRFRPALRPEMPARQAMVVVYSDLLAIMRRNEPGMINDLDVEFLHDFRVALRRTRSGLSLVKNVLPAPASESFRRRFSWLGEVTGPLRDLDVYLQAERGYQARLPEALHAGLAPFFTDLRNRRANELQQLVRCLKSKKYSNLSKSWRQFLESSGGEEEMKNSARPVSELARRIIARRFRRMLKAGRAIEPTSPAQDYHRLRIQGKKLRYALEFFSSLFPQEEVESAIKELKHLQDHLGAYNDLAVQQEVLQVHLAGLRSGSRRNLALAAAIGGLLTSLSHDQGRVRDEFAGYFAEFARAENVELYRRLCRLTS